MQFPTQKFSFHWLLSGITIGVVSGLINLIFEISYAALIFSGPLAGYLAQGVGLTLFGTVVVGILISLNSSFPGMVACPMGAPISILAAAAMAMSVHMPSASPEELFFTVLATIAVTSLLTGAVFLILGHWQSGDFIRFVPYPVIGGFLSGVGWLVLKGSIGIMTGVSPRLTHVPMLLKAEALIQWLPACLFGVLLLLISRRYTHFLILPAMLLLAFGAFYLLLFMADIPLNDARARGWLFEGGAAGISWQPFLFSAFRQADWATVFGQAGTIGAIVLVSLLSLLLYASAIEITAREDMDFNHELQIAGFANILGGLGVAPVGFHNLSNNILALEMGAHTRLMGVCSAAVCGLPLILRVSFLPWIPKPVLGGLLVFVGLSFVVKWVYDARLTLPLSDYLLILIILGVVAILGFLEGVAVGTLIATILFVIKYSRVGIIKHTLSGSTYHSTVERAIPYQRQLQEQGEQVTIFLLEGFLFFGTSNMLFKRVCQRVDESTRLALRYLILDFRSVNGLDSSALHSFVRIRQLSERKNFSLIFTHLSPEIQRQFHFAGQLSGDHQAASLVFPDTDRGLEWCEEQILNEEEASPVDDTPLLGETFLETVFDDVLRSLERREQFEGMIENMMSYLDRRQFDAGQYVIRQGEASEALYIIESGRIAVWLDNERHQRVRLRTMGAGTIVGEISVYSGIQASASAIATEAAVAYRITKQSLERMEALDPELASMFHKFIASLLGERLAHVNELLQTLGLSSFSEPRDA